MQITVRKLSLTFQNSSLFGYETFLKLKFDELSIKTTDNNWVAKFNADP